MNATWPGSVMGLMGLTNPDKDIYVSNFPSFAINPGFSAFYLSYFLHTYVCIIFKFTNILQHISTHDHIWHNHYHLQAQSLQSPYSHYKVCTSRYHDTIYLWTHTTTTPPIPHYSTALINTDDLYLFRSRFP